GNISNNVALVFNRTDEYTYTGLLTGSGSLNQFGTGTTTLSGDNSGYTGAAVISAGTLELVNAFGGTVTTQSGGTLHLSDGSTYNTNIINNGATVFNRTGDYTYSGSVTGMGQITTKQDGILTLSGNNAVFTGTTTVADGTLLRTGALGGSATVNNGATFQIGDATHS